MFAERWDCETCKRSRDYGCRERVDRHEAWKQLEGVDPHGQPLIFVADRLRICPRSLVSSWAYEMIRAYAWWEKGALGLDYIDTPRKIADAFTLIGSEIDKAQRVRLDEDRARR